MCIEYEMQNILTSYISTRIQIRRNDRLTVASIIFRLRVASIFVVSIFFACVYSHWPKYPAERSHDVISGLFPVLSDVENFIFKKFCCTKKFDVKFQGESLGR